MEGTATNGSQGPGDHPTSPATVLHRPAPLFSHIVVYTASDLVELLTVHQQSLLVLDCRSFVAFNKTHIKGAVNMTCPSLLIKRMQQQRTGTPRKRRMSKSGHRTSVIERLVSSPEVREMCRRGSIATVVLYDDSVDDPREDDGCLLYTMLQLLEHEGPTVGFLTGGFQEFAEKHADFCYVQPATDARPTMPPPPPSARLRKENMDLEPIEILPYLYLGNQRNSSDLKSLTNLGITYVLNVAKECKNCLDNIPGFIYKNVPLLDTTEQEINSVFEDCFQFIESARAASGRVLVHCVGGISRSVAVTLAYLMRSQHMCLDDAYTFIKGRKQNISPNLSFMGQLLEFEKAELARRRADGEVLHVVPSVVEEEDGGDLEEDLSEESYDEEEGEEGEVETVFAFGGGGGGGSSCDGAARMFGADLEQTLAGVRLDSPTHPISVGKDGGSFTF
eukprot:comp20084_c1_seq1/m.24731 comp20084_c1_seq1/g.24731  ORF comp20084_c1_seq1/g.24731 comp20084_c1_seq1/m.24731 type:complete len:448 (-) comp20084_c1_seq1:337-1680(-)